MYIYGERLNNVYDVPDILMNCVMYCSNAVPRDSRWRPKWRPRLKMFTWSVNVACNFVERVVDLQLAVGTMHMLCVLKMLKQSFWILKGQGQMKGQKVKIASGFHVSK